MKFESWGLKEDFLEWKFKKINESTNAKILYQFSIGVFEFKLHWKS